MIRAAIHKCSHKEYKVLQFSHLRVAKLNKINEDLGPGEFRYRSLDVKPEHNITTMQGTLVKPNDIM